MKIYENIISVAVADHSIRVWMSREEEGPSSAEDLRDIAAFVKENWGERYGVDEMKVAQAIAEGFKRANAIEVKSAPDRGVVFYPSWP
jgi:hypothetical protein